MEGGSTSLWLAELLPRYSIWATAMACCLQLCSLFPATAVGQPEELFDIEIVEASLAKRFRLTDTDRMILRPLVNSESDRLLSLYEVYSDQDDPDFVGLWNAVRRLPKPPHNVLTRRQQRAFDWACVELESLLLEGWLDEYLEVLDERLDLDRLQSKYVRAALEEESRERLKILRREAEQHSPVADPRWEKVNSERDRKLALILSESQMRAYRRLKGPVELVAVSVQSSLSP